MKLYTVKHIYKIKKSHDVATLGSHHFLQAGWKLEQALAMVSLSAVVSLMADLSLIAVVGPAVHLHSKAPPHKIVERIGLATISMVSKWHLLNI